MEQYLGFMQDLPRHELPPGFCWDLVNFIPDLDGSARRRYGFASLGTQDFSALNVSAVANGAFVAYCPFSSVAHEVLAGNGQGYMFSFQEPSLTGSYVAQLPAAAQPKSRPVWHRDQLLIPLGYSAAAAVIYKGRAAGFTTGLSTPHGSCGTLWGDYSVLANDLVSNKQRLWFSAAGDPTSWDTTNSWQDIPGVVKGVEGIRGAILAWTDHELWRVTGTTPPSSGIVGDLDLKHFADTGLADERSVAEYGGWIIWANAEGVWITDGASAPKNLTVSGGINSYWRSIMAGYNIAATDYIVAAGVYRGYYVVGVASLANNVQTTLLCDLASNHWFRFAVSWTPAMFSHGVSGHEDAYWISSFGQRVVSTASAWETPSFLEYDSGRLPASLETPFFRGFQRYHRKWIPSNAPSVWQRLYLTYDGASFPTGANALRVGYTTSPELGAAYTTVGTLPYTSVPGRVRIPVNPNGGAVPARGIAFRIDQTGTSYTNDLRVNDLELEYFTREGSR